MTKRSIFAGCTLALISLFAVPLPAYALCTTFNGQQFCDNSPDPAQTAAPASSGNFSTQGIFGCGNTSGSMSQSVGTMSAIGGTFVPVNDAAVTLNTGSLVYKECILRGMVDRERESAIAALVKQSTTQFLNGRNGNPMFPEVIAQDKLNRSDAVVATDINGARLNMINPAFQNDVKLAVNRAYYEQTRDTSGALTCSYAGTPDQLNAVLHARQFNSFYDVLALTDPNCIPLSAYYNAQNLVMNDVAADESEMMTRLNWSNGIYGVETVDSNGVRRTLTPGFFVAGTMQQQLGSGFRQQENANDIDQMVGSLFTGIGNALISQAMGGLRGLVQNTISGHSYLDLVVQDSSSRLNETAVNAGLQVLVAARQSEAAYLAAKQALGGLLLQTTSQLRAAESVCWSAIVPAAMNYAATGGCTAGTACSGSFSIKVATTTAFSQTVINANIAPLATSSAAAVAASSAALGQIDQLLVGITATSSPITQSAALHQLDGLVAQGALHNQYDVQTAQQQVQDAQGALSTLLTNTAKHWGDDPLSTTDPSSGWCNTNNTDVIKMWALKWRI